MSYGIIGFGNIGQTIGLCLRQKYPKAKIIASTASGKASRLNWKLDIESVSKDDNRIFTRCREIYLCVKPKDIDEVLTNHLRVGPEHTLVSAVAGVSSTYIRRRTKSKRVLRIMPTVTAPYGGPVVYYNPSQLDKELPFENLLEVSSEDLLDKSTGQSGCMPGFLANLSEMWIDALTDDGLTYETAEWLLYHNMKGLLEMTKDRHQLIDFGEIVKKVASEGGATQKGLSRLTSIEHNFYQAIHTANKRVFEVKDLFKD